jgi:hypothetical protein
MTGQNGAKPITRHMSVYIQDHIYGHVSTVHHRDTECNTIAACDCSVMKYSGRSSIWLTTQADPGRCEQGCVPMFRKHFTGRFGSQRFTTTQGTRTQGWNNLAGGW